MMNEQLPCILDCTAGYRAMWRNKQDPAVLFLDKRREVKPDIIAVWQYLPFVDNAFDGAVKDPPHMLYQSKGKPMAFNFEARYGVLNRKTWQTDLAKGLSEVLRVIKPGGLLLYKWNDNHIAVKRFLKCLPQKPVSQAAMVGSRGVRRPGSSEPRSRTWWFCFLKN